MEIEVACDIFYLYNYLKILNCYLKFSFDLSGDRKIKKTSVDVPYIGCEIAHIYIYIYIERVNTLCPYIMGVKKGPL